MHPLYNHARSFIGQPVVIHAYGRPHYGILHSVTTDGTYLNRISHTGYSPTDANTTDEDAAELVFLPFLFLPWLAIAALSPLWWW